MFKLVELKYYLKMPLIKVDGVNVFPEEIIKYVCNKLGAVHHDKKRDPKKPQDQKFLILDKLQNDFLLLGQGPVWIEFLSIGQSIANSRAIDRLMRAIQSLLRDHKT